MKYDHVLFNNMLEILQHTKERLKERGNSTMYAEVDRIYQDGINNFSLPQNQLAWALNYLCTEQGLLPSVGLDNFSEDEKEAAMANDLKATSTEAGKKAVQEAHRRLLRAKKMRPVTDAKKVVAEAEALQAKKKKAEETARAEHERPSKELSEAESELKKVKSALKKAEKEIGV